jgi:hypothetical protein
MAKVVVRRANEHIFFGLATLALLAIVLIGFAKTYFLAGVFLAPLPSPLVHVHAVLNVGWLLLLLVQVVLAATAHLRWHRQLGSLLAVWVLLMLLVGPPTVVMAVRRPHSDVGGREFFGDLAQLLVFAILVGTALARRGDSATHKRLMLLGTAVLMLPALARWPFALPLPVFLGLYLSVPFALVAWDAATLRRVHPATVGGLGLIALVIVATLAIPSTPLWIDVVRAVKGA